MRNELHLVYFFRNIAEEMIFWLDFILVFHGYEANLLHWLIQ